MPIRSDSTCPSHDSLEEREDGTIERHAYLGSQVVGAATQNVFSVSSPRQASATRFCLALPFPMANTTCATQFFDRYSHSKQNKTASSRSH
jgi:hypothetical protein